jgi:mono/diheme cytochrome c family protein
MVNNFPIGAILGPNITAGQGSRTINFAASDWDRAVRHGVKHDGMVSIMPAEDFQDVSDQELSDVVSYIRSAPPVDATVPLPKLGPVGTILVATGQLPLAVDIIPNHMKAHATYPPEAAVNVEFGKHLAAICSGCHHDDFAGGKIVGGDPSWPPSMNLTSHADGLAGWTYDQFANVVTTGKKLDGTALREPMTLMLPVIQAMTDTERQALWKFLQSLPPVPSPKS